MYRADGAVKTRPFGEMELANGVAAQRRLRQAARLWCIAHAVYRLVPIGLLVLQRTSYSTVTLLARLRGWSTSVPLATAV